MTADGPFSDPSHGSDEDLSDTVAAWSSRPDISARSVLVTIFGDAILPASNRFWLAQMFRLTKTLGFNQRLVRTSMFRLAAEGWVTNERVGRQSQYTLTPLAARESEQASTRIYRDVAPDWTGSWTLAMIGDGADHQQARTAIVQQLQWNGFLPLGPNVLGSPSIEPAAVREMLSLLRSLTTSATTTVQVALATAEFEELPALVEGGFFAAALNTGAVEKQYQEFLERYHRLAPAAAAAGPEDAFALRTMLIHDLRRIRLRAPDVPAELLPEQWVGTDAFALAGRLYAALTARSAGFLGDVMECAYPPVFPDRF